MRLNKELKLLLVEDDEDSVDLIKTALGIAALPVELSVAFDGIEALNYLTGAGPFTQASVPDLILMDLNLPKKNGRQLMADMAASEDLRKIPVILFTTTEWHNDLKELYPSLDGQCYSKPMRFQDYIELLKKIYAQAQQGSLKPLGAVPLKNGN